MISWKKVLKWGREARTSGGRGVTSIDNYLRSLKSTGEVSENANGKLLDRT